MPCDRCLHPHSEGRSKCCCTLAVVRCWRSGWAASHNEHRANQDPDGLSVFDCVCVLSGVLHLHNAHQLEPVQYA